MNSKIIVGLLIISVLFVAGCTSTTQGTPTISQLVPDTGTVGSEVTIHGSGFDPTGNVVKFGAGYISNLASDGTSTRFTVPDGLDLCNPNTEGPCPGGANPQVNPGSYLVGVISRGGTSNSMTFTVIAQGTLPPVSTVAVKEFNMTATRFSFDPSTVTVNKGDHVVINVHNIDTVAHGFSLATYNIIESIDPGQTKTVKFTATKVGEFNFFCSVFCGSGHADMRGKIIVNP